MENYAYIFTVFSGCFALIQIIRLFYPYFKRIINRIRQGYAEEQEEAPIFLSKAVNITMYVVSLAMVLLSSMFIIYTRANKLNYLMTISQLEDRLDKYHAEVNLLKSELGHDMSQCIQQKGLAELSRTEGTNKRNNPENP